MKAAPLRTAIPSTFSLLGGYLAVAVALATSLAGCRKEPVENLAAPTMLRFYNDADTVGAVVHIIGTNFSQNPANNVVQFAAQPAAGFAVHGDTLQVRVPAGATTGPLTLRVYEQQAVSTETFTVVTGHWRRKADFGGGPRGATTSFALYDIGYVGGGTNDWWAYHPGTNKWVRQADMPGANRSEALSFTIGSIGIVGFGRDVAANQLGDLYIFDPFLNKWSQVWGPVGIRADEAVTFSLNGKGYLITTSYFQKVTWEYTPQTGSWVQKAPFPGPERYLAAGMVIGDKGYMGGGTMGHNPLLQDFWEYNPVADTWTRKADLPQASGSAMGFAVGPKGYWGFGSAFTNRFFEYDPAQDTWQRKANFPGRAKWHATAFAIGPKGYVATGYTNTYPNADTAELWEFTP